MFERRADRMRAELLLYWRVSREVRGRGRVLDDVSLSHVAAQEEFSALAGYSDWGRLRTLCASNLPVFESDLAVGQGLA